MTKIPRKEFQVFAVLLIVLMSGLISLHVNTDTIGYMPVRSTRLVPNASQTVNSIDSPVNTVYLAANLTIPSNSSYYIVNENLVIESLISTSLGIVSYGNLYILNSTITISNASYSTVKNFTLTVSNGSELNIQNSTLQFPGSINISDSKVTVTDSYINSSEVPGTQSYRNTLRIGVHNSTLKISNSTVAGLYRQNGSYEYNDGGLYCYEPGFSQNAKVPMAISSVNKDESLINSVLINVTYVGNSTENLNYLSVYYNGSVIDTLQLPYTVNQTSRQSNFTVNFTGILHTLSWIANSTNFYLVANINFPDAIALSNVTETLQSNDTVDLYGQSYYAYQFYNSTVILSNDTLGLNEKQMHTTNGSLNPFRLSLIASNSTLIMGDTNLQSSNGYSDPFFTLINSYVYLFRYLEINAFSGGIQVNSLNISISPETWSPGMISKTTGAEFQKILNVPNLNNTVTGRQYPVLYEFTDNGINWNYTDQFYVSHQNSTAMASIPPFPNMFENDLEVNLTTQIPFATFNISTADLYANNNENISVSYSGNLSELPSLTAEWQIHSWNGTWVQGNSTFLSPISVNVFTIPIASNTAFSSGSYALEVHFTSPYSHAFKNDGWCNSTFNIHSSNIPSSYNVSVHAIGLKKGSVWGVELNGTGYYSDNSTMILSITSAQNASVIIPAGMNTRTPDISLTKSVSQYDVTFYQVLHSITFQNSGLKTGSYWSVIIAGEIYKVASNNITLKLNPGDYNYQILDPAGYSITNSSGIVNITTSDGSVNISSARNVSFMGSLSNKISSPMYYIPALIIFMIAISLGTWKSSHRWYVCKNCGSTRKRKRQDCPYCGSSYRN